MDQNEYKQRMDQIFPPVTGTSRVMERAGRFRRPRPVLAVALVLAVLLTVPVLAVQSPAVREWLYEVLKDSERLVPVRLSDTCNGITVEVCGLEQPEEGDLLPGPGLILAVEYADGTPLEEEPRLDHVYFDGDKTWYATSGCSYIWPDRADKMLRVSLFNPGATLEDLKGATTTILIDRMYIGERLVEGPWRISFRFGEDLTSVLPVE